MPSSKRRFKQFMRRDVNRADEGIIRLDESRVDEASHVLARAFYDDPLQTYVFPDPAQRAALSPAHFAPLIRYGLLAGDVWTTPGVVAGVSIWWPPEHITMSDEALERSGFNALPDTIGQDAFERFMNMLDHIEPFHRRDMPRPHWYAMVIGVDPSMKGQGVGSRLVAKTLQQADANGVPCYLETCQPSNVAFYQKNGFDVLLTGTESTSGLRYWTFQREAPGLKSKTRPTEKSKTRPTECLHSARRSSLDPAHTASSQPGLEPSTRPC